MTLLFINKLVVYIERISDQIQWLPKIIWVIIFKFPKKVVPFSSLFGKTSISLPAATRYPPSFHIFSKNLPDPSDFHTFHIQASKYIPINLYTLFSITLLVQSICLSLSPIPCTSPLAQNWMRTSPISFPSSIPPLSLSLSFLRARDFIFSWSRSHWRSRGVVDLAERDRVRERRELAARRQVSCGDEKTPTMRCTSPCKYVCTRKAPLEALCMQARRDSHGIYLLNISQGQLAAAAIEEFVLMRQHVCVRRSIFARLSCLTKITLT